MKKMNKKLKLVVLSALSLAATTSCVDNGFGRDDWDVPNLYCSNRFGEPTMTLANFVALAPSTGRFEIEDDIIIDGYVVSSDEHGNFYKTISFQDSPNNPTIGLQIELDRSNNYADFPVGAHIRINAKGLVLASDRGVVKLGSKDATYTVGRIPDAQVSNYMSIVCNNGFADITNITPLELNSLAEAQDTKYLNMLVKVPGVQFKDADGTITYVDASSDTDRTIVDANATEAVIRTSSYATFGAETLPTGSGDITFVVSRYNNNYQMIIRNASDVDFTNPRFRASQVKGGTNITYYGAGTKIDFESYSTGAASEAFPEFYNDPITNNFYWRVAAFSGNKYIQISAFNRNTPQPESKTYFAVPVDFDNMATLSFKTKDGHNNGSVLKVYYSNDYTPTNANPTLVDITSNFTIANSGPASGYAANFTDSGNWSKPSTLTGKGFIIFEYLGGAGAGLPTTTIQIDDITIN